MGRVKYRPTIPNRTIYNPLVIDPENYDILFDEDIAESESSTDSREYDDLSNGSRKKKPVFDSDF